MEIKEPAFSAAGSGPEGKALATGRSLGTEGINIVMGLLFAVARMVAISQWIWPTGKEISSEDSDGVIQWLHAQIVMVCPKIRRKNPER
jgi:hypothetical protein